MVIYSIRSATGRLSSFEELGIGLDLLPKVYNPEEIERRWYATWEERKLFHASDRKTGKEYSIVIPPPNVTGSLHMGHALNNTLQDILIRYHRMAGYNTLWMPGMDHAGIATQNVVERQLKEEGLRREDLGREKFIERVWTWKAHSGGVILNQLKRLGSSCSGIVNVSLWMRGFHVRSGRSLCGSIRTDLSIAAITSSIGALAVIRHYRNLK